MIASSTGGIKREAVDRRQIDFSDVSTGRRLPPVHPGEILRDEFLKPMDLSVYALARALGISRPRLNDIVLGRRGVTTDTALRLGRYFGMTPEFWINLQTRYDLDVAERTVRVQIEHEVEPRAGATRPNA
jgi:addiction module HigA family antidote